MKCQYTEYSLSQAERVWLVALAAPLLTATETGLGGIALKLLKMAYHLITVFENMYFFKITFQTCHIF
jgi:hypothetical protein